MEQRNHSLDALRGFSILAMVLSGSIAFGILPDWMYHAQVPPPAHVFQPALPGITWVDLVFPFFLFSMGAAIPLAFTKRLKEHQSFLQIVAAVAGRFCWLIFFAIFTLHARAKIISADPHWQAQLLSICCFILLFLIFTHWRKSQRLLKMLRWIALLLALAFLYWMPFADGKGFQLNRSDIIIIVLANMALFGSVWWLLTQKSTWMRLGILPFIMAILLASGDKNSWNAVVFNWTPAGWAYQFYYLKYLFVIIPATYAGEWLLKSGGDQKTTPGINDTITACLALLLVIMNVIFLYQRNLLLNLIASIIIIAVISVLQRNKDKESLYSQLCRAGSYLLTLGLFFEAYEGGIKKDHSTYSYYFVTAGLAFFTLFIFNIFQYSRLFKKIVHYLALNGRNPMVAYVAGNLLLLPILYITGGISLFQNMESNIWLGVLRGVLFTWLVSLITIFFAKHKLYWKT